VTPVLAAFITVGALIGAGWCLVMLTLRGPKGQKVLLGALALLELVMLAQTVLGIAKVTGIHRHISSVTFVGYLLGWLLILPAAAWWSLAERSRWGVGILLLACLVVPVLVVRINQIWSGYGV
jgi:hypothetical protein